MPEFNHQVAATRGVLEQECSELLKKFFSELRVRNKAEKLAARENAQSECPSDEVDSETP